MALTPTEADMISAAIESALIDLHVALPGQVQSYDAVKQTATIELQVQRVLPQGINFTTESLPVLENVPVQFPRTKRFILSFPLEAGDYGQVVFNEMSIDQWRSKGENTSPGDIGRHTLSGGVFQPGLMPNSEAIGDDVSTDLVLGEIGGVQVRVKPGGVCQVVSNGALLADDFVSQAGKTEAGLQTIVDAITGAAVVANDGGAAFKANIILALTDPVASVASSNLKADD